MDLQSLFTSDLEKAKQQAQQSAGNALFNFLGLSLQEKAQDAGLQIKSQFVPKVDQNPKVESSVAQMAGGMSSSQMIFLGVAAVIGAALFFTKSKRAA